MAEPTVQVPVSLITEADEVMREGTRHARYIMAARLDALLSQPTPTAELSALGLREHIGPDGSNYIMPAEPIQRPEHMSVGTTFVHLSATWEVVDGGRAVGVNVPGQGIACRHLSTFDPSTIRDVTPPAVTK